MTAAPLAAVAVLLGLSTLIAPHRAYAHPSSQLSTPVYSPGWNMVGGPIRDTLSGASAVYMYTPAGYVAPASRATPRCQAYWAYFPRAWSVNLDVPSVNVTTTPRGITFHCYLQPGWNMVGNPFLSVAALPAGMTGYRWDTVHQRYQSMQVVLVAGAVWIYTDSAMSVTLTAV